MGLNLHRRSRHHPLELLVILALVGLAGLLATSIFNRFREERCRVAQAMLAQAVSRWKPYHEEVGSEDPLEVLLWARVEGAYSEVQRHCPPGGRPPLPLRSLR